MFLLRRLNLERKSNPGKSNNNADDGSLFGLGEMCERECWGRDEREGYFGLKSSFMANVDRNLFRGLRWKKPKIL